MSAEERVWVRSGKLKLEAILHKPTGGVRGWALVCHPHPLYGGNMYNNVVVALAYRLAEEGLSVLRFNFRGVGDSQGTYEGEDACVEDVLACMEFLRELGEEELYLLGYSFGAYVGLRALLEAEAKAAVAISPPLLMYDFEFLKDVETPLLIVCGGRDVFSPNCPSLEAFLSPGSKLVVVNEADHFWWGLEQKLVDEVWEFLKNFVE